MSKNTKPSWKRIMGMFDGSYWSDGVELEHVKNLQQYHNDQIERIEKSVKKFSEFVPWTEENHPTEPGMYWIAVRGSCDKEITLVAVHLREHHIQEGCYMKKQVVYWAHFLKPKFDPALP
jgi:hypothetical protein